jgi:hypothetical protein
VERDTICVSSTLCVGTTVAFRHRFRLTSHSRGVLLGTLLLGSTACGGGPRDDSMDRELFVATYVDLRITASETFGLRLGDSEREEVLARHGVSAAELYYFAEAHAEDLEFMRDVWNEVEFRLDREADAN